MRDDRMEVAGGDSAAKGFAEVAWKKVGVVAVGRLISSRTASRRRIVS